MLIVDYSPNWPRAFVAIQTVLATALTHIDLRIEHVGSTAVAGLAAKPIIDIDLLLGPSVDLSTVADRLAPLGYVHVGDQGIPGRAVFRRPPGPTPHPILDTIPHHLYAGPTNSPELNRHLLFRDYLRQHPADCRAYARLKRDLAERAGQDRKRYAALKEQEARAFVETTLANARDGL
ncbi:GrpB family protein [Spirosoma luteolum]